MTPALEKVARAIYALSPLQDQPVDPDMRPTGPWFDVSWEAAADDEGIRDHYRDAARAALAALLPPSPEVGDAMIRCGDDLHSQPGPQVQSATELHQLLFTSAIKSILGEDHG